MRKYERFRSILFDHGNFLKKLDELKREEENWKYYSESTGLVIYLNKQYQKACKNQNTEEINNLKQIIVQLTEILKVFSAIAQDKNLDPYSVRKTFTFYNHLIANIKSSLQNKKDAALLDVNYLRSVSTILDMSKTFKLATDEINLTIDNLTKNAIPAHQPLFKFR